MTTILMPTDEQWDCIRRAAEYLKTGGLRPFVIPPGIQRELERLGGRIPESRRAETDAALSDHMSIGSADYEFDVMVADRDDADYLSHTPAHFFNALNNSDLSTRLEESAIALGLKPGWT